MSFLRDIRIVQLKHFYGNRSGSENGGLHTFSYFNEVEVLPVSKSGGNDSCGNSQPTLMSAYSALEECLKESLGSTYHSQQTLIAISGDKTEAEMEDTKDFWSNNKAWLFLTMINVPLSETLRNAANHIKKICLSQTDADTKYQIYFSFDFNEILVFCKTNSFNRYMETVSKLNFQRDGGYPTPILDTVTVCGYNKACAGTSKDRLNAQISLGITNTESFEEFLESCIKDDVFDDKVEISHSKMIGRNDVCLMLKNITLFQLQNVFAQYESPRIPAPWISTYEIMLTAAKSEESVTKSADRHLNIEMPLGRSRLDLAGVDDPKIIEAFKLLEEKVDSFLKVYEKYCKKQQISFDPAFARIIREMEIMLKNPLIFQLASDLVVCLLPQLFDFAIYMQTQMTIENKEKQGLIDNRERDVEKLLNTFYLDVSSLVSSTVHSARQFVQIPHCGVTALEMPPKIMAYYSIMAHEISAALNDRKEVFFGVMLSPHLVSEPEVLPMPTLDGNNDDHMLSISISENMLYNPIRTISILGHEIAHFVGDRARCRPYRLRQIAAYYIHKYLQDFFMIYGDIIGLDTSETLNEYVPTYKLLSFAKYIAKTYFPESDNMSYNKMAILRDSDFFMNAIADIYYKLLSDRVTMSRIFNRWLYRNGKPLLFADNIRNNLTLMLGASFRQEGEQCDNRLYMSNARLAKEYISKAFDSAADIYKSQFLQSFDKVKKEFNNQIEYLFSECYADISMIMMYEMQPDSFANLYIHGRPYDATEFARFRAVARALYKAGIWGDDDRPLSLEVFYSEDSDWESHIKTLCKLCVQESWKPEYTEAINRCYKVDWPLQYTLQDYLSECIVVQKNVLRENKEQVKNVRERFKTGNVLSEPSYDAVEKIHDLEWGYLREIAGRYGA